MRSIRAYVRERVAGAVADCRDATLDEAVETIRAAAHTGRRGDGIIVVAPVDDTLRISDGVRGERGRLR